MAARRRKGRTVLDDIDETVRMKAGLTRTESTRGILGNGPEDESVCSYCTTKDCTNCEFCKKPKCACCSELLDDEGNCGCGCTEDPAYYLIAE